MKTLRLMVLALVLGFTAATAESKQIQTDHMYIFGFSASFVDSTLYITDIQDVVGAWYDTKERVLLSRDSYSYQLKEYLENKGLTNRVCLVMYAKTKRKAEKKYKKLKKKYTGKDGRIIGLQYLTADDFKFTPVDSQ